MSSRADFILASSSGLAQVSSRVLRGVLGVGDGDGLLQIGRQAHQGGHDIEAVSAGLAALEPGAVRIGDVGQRIHVADVFRLLASCSF